MFIQRYNSEQEIWEKPLWLNKNFKIKKLENTTSRQALLLVLKMLMAQNDHVNIIKETTQLGT